MKILVATDGSKHALNAVKYAAKLVANTRSSDTITLISVHDDIGYRRAAQFVGKAEVEDYLRELSEKDLKPAQKVLDTAKIKHNNAIVIGHVSEEIVKFASAGKYDMIVMGSKGRSSFADLLIGSVAQRVLATAKQPVLLVK
ncbi:MAG TPA: universal stress protein [Rhodocyclaceae bacterium]|nr:universal stress protein [Rhodocyclaceae bacterium]